MIRHLMGPIGLVGLLMSATVALAAGPGEIAIGYLGPARVGQTLSLVEQPAENDGIAGARLAIEDNMPAHKLFQSPVYLPALTHDRTASFGLGVEAIR